MPVFSYAIFHWLLLFSGQEVKSIIQQQFKCVFSFTVFSSQIILHRVHLIFVFFSNVNYKLLKLYYVTFLIIFKQVFKTMCWQFGVFVGHLSDFYSTVALQCGEKWHWILHFATYQSLFSSQVPLIFIRFCFEAQFRFPFSLAKTDRYNKLTINLKWGFWNFHPSHFSNGFWDQQC